MSIASAVRLFLLAAIWGGSFLFLRLGAPVLGPVLFIQLRVALGALFLLFVALIHRKPLELKGHLRHYAILGVFNTGFPFLLFAFGALHITASLESVLNATAAIWGAMISAVWLRVPLSLKAMIGLALGLGGVAVLVGLDAGRMDRAAWIAVACGLAAAFSYGLASAYIQKAKRPVSPFANAHGSLWAATLMFVPATPFFPPVAAVTPMAAIAVVCIGVLCSGIAYMVYFKLLGDIGAAPTLTVSFLIPVFGILWGVLFLHERVGWNMPIGAVLIVTGTALATGFSPRGLLAGPDQTPARSI
jgi:drug/metabolite transporter (DMT)-like permease